MKTGDNPAWAEPEFEHGAWNSVRIGTSWEESGFPGYDGYAWYRVRFDIPGDWRSLLDENQDRSSTFLVLSLGPVDDADVTYFNGKEIGATGTMPPKYASAYAVKRRYRIPLNKVNWNGSNVIAVRVYDDDGLGGIYEGPVVVEPPLMEDILEPGFILSSSNGIYSSPDPIPVTLKVSNHSSRKYRLSLECTLKSDRVDDNSTLQTIRTEIEIDRNREEQKVMNFDPPGPGFYRVACKFSDSKTPPFEKSTIFGYDPEKIKPPLTRQMDFEDFWNNRKQDLERIEPRFTLTRSDQSTGELDVYLLEMVSYGHVRIKGWYSVPRKPGPYPAILSLPGYNMTMRPYLHRKNVATLALNPRGHGNSKDDVDPKGGEYMYLGFDPKRPEEYIYVGAYMDCVRAVDFLASRPEIDPARIGVEGGSQGGGLSFATAALDPRVAFCAPDIPWLGDWLGYTAASDWPRDHYPELIARIPGLTFDDIHRILSYIDTMNLADRIRCPVLMSVGLQDSVCPPRTAFATYNQVRSRKEFRVYPFADHAVGQEHNPIKNAWMATVLGIKQL